ncbi:MAG: SDR family oxidoreductase [Pirellulales bacterium]|nr:SDR family oxidoreductase [Pirellulales bacterium]
MTAQPSNAKRLIVLTGATRGLGRALVEAFVADGHTVIGCGRSTADVAALRSRFPEPCRFDAVDVVDDVAVAAWAGAVLDSHGPPELLINNAAVINRVAPLWEISAAEFDQLMAVNVRGTANVLRHLLPAMIRRGAGVIVNLSSGWGRSTSPNVAPYCASKYAIEGLTLALAQELPQGMAAVPVNPGIINTDMLRSCFGKDAVNYPTPEQWARKAAPFLLGLAAQDNGRSLSVPGAPE